jgi:hypothetical protein
LRHEESQTRALHFVLLYQTRPRIWHKINRRFIDG